MPPNDSPEQECDVSVHDLISEFRRLKSDVQTLHLPDETVQELKEIAQAVENELTVLLVADVQPHSFVALKAMPYLTVCFYELAERCEEGGLTDEQAGNAIRTLAKFRNLLSLTYTGIYMEQ